MPDHLPARSGSHLPAQGGPDAALVRRTFPAQVAAMEASPHYAAHLDAVQSVVVVLGLPTTEAQVLAICLALHENGVTPQQAAVLARVLRDDPEFNRGTVRFGAPMVPGDWIGAWLRLPRPGARYTPDDVAAFLRLGYPRQAFVRCDGTEGATHPFCYAPTVAPTTEDAT